MNEHEWLAEQFESNRTHLRAVAYRMLGSLPEAEDAVQESWLHLSRSDASNVSNMTGWLTTIVSHICLDMLRARKSRLTRENPEPPPSIDPEQETLLAESVGLALLVVLDSLSPAERLTFILHDLFAVPFNEISLIIGRSEIATRQLASRARRRVRGLPTEANINLTHNRELVDAFLAASREGDFATLLNMLDPDAIFRFDPTAIPQGTSEEIHGAASIARLFSGRAQETQSALINNSIGIVVAPRGRLQLVLTLTITANKISAINVISNPTQLHQLTISLFPTN